MAKELPYFRFTPQEWQNGDISLESYAIKGLFVDVCSYYWVQDCVVTKKMLFKKFRNARKNLTELIELDILKHNSTTDEVVILYLNTQYDLLSESRINKQKAGSLGGSKKASNAKEVLKQKPSYKDKDKEKENNKEKDYILLSELSDESGLSENEHIAYSFFLLFKENLKETGLSATHLDKAKLSSWTNTVRLMMEQDDRKAEEFRVVFKFLKADDWWKKNVRGIDKLRKQFETLYVNAKQHKKPNLGDGVDAEYLQELKQRLS